MEVSRSQQGTREHHIQSRHQTTNLGQNQQPEHWSNTQLGTQSRPTREHHTGHQSRGSVPLTAFVPNTSTSEASRQDRSISGASISDSNMPYSNTEIGEPITQPSEIEQSKRPKFSHLTLLGRIVLPAFVAFYVCVCGIVVLVFGLKYNKTVGKQNLVSFDWSYLLSCVAEDARTRC